MLEDMGISVKSAGIGVQRDKYYLVNLNADPIMSELLVCYLKVCLSVSIYGMYVLCIHNTHAHTQYTHSHTHSHTHTHNTHTHNTDTHTHTHTIQTHTLTVHTYTTHPCTTLLAAYKDWST